MSIIESFEIESGELKIEVSVICYGCFDGFADQWEGTDKHQGGVTIKNPNADRNSWKYFIPQQGTLAGLVSCYAKQGRDNPSATAYRSLQNQLERDITASDYGFRATAYVGDILVLDDEYVGCMFDYSYDDDGDLIDVARLVWDEYDTTKDVIELAKKSAANILESVPALTLFTK